MSTQEIKKETKIVLTNTIVGYIMCLTTQIKYGGKNMKNKKEITQIKDMPELKDMQEVLKIFSTFDEATKRTAMATLTGMRLVSEAEKKNKGEGQAS